MGNRIYIGEIAHKESSYQGGHEAIIDPELWQRVHAKLAENAHARRHGTNASAPSLLRGLLYDEQGNRFTPSHAVKNGRRYRYYVLQQITRKGLTASNEPSRIPARDIETLILARLKEFLESPEQVVTSLSLAGDDVAVTRDLVEAAGECARNLNQHSAARVNEMLTAIAFRATAARESVSIQLRRDAIRARLLGAEVDANHRDEGNKKDLIAVAIPVKLNRCKGEMRLIIPGLYKRPAAPTCNVFRQGNQPST